MGFVYLGTGSGVLEGAHTGWTSGTALPHSAGWDQTSWALLTVAPGPRELIPYPATQSQGYCAGSLKQVTIGILGRQEQLQNWREGPVRWASSGIKPVLPETFFDMPSLH